MEAKSHTRIGPPASLPIMTVQASPLPLSTSFKNPVLDEERKCESEVVVMTFAKQRSDEDFR